jgi:hypothetical protein
MISVFFSEEVRKRHSCGGEPDSSVSVVSGYGLDDGRRDSIPGRGEKIFPLASVSRPTLGPTQPPVQWVQGVLSSGLRRGRGVTLTTHPHVVPSVSMACSGAAFLIHVGIRLLGFPFYCHSNSIARVYVLIYVTSPVRYFSASNGVG